MVNGSDNALDPCSVSVVGVMATLVASVNRILTDPRPASGAASRVMPLVIVRRLLFAFCAVVLGCLMITEWASVFAKPPRQLDKVEVSRMSSQDLTGGLCRRHILMLLLVPT